MAAFSTPFSSATAQFNFCIAFSILVSLFPPLFLGYLPYVYLAPGFISKEMEMFRIIPILPILLIIVTIGLNALISNFNSQWKIIFLSTFLFFSTSLDFYHLAVPYHQGCAQEFGRWTSYSKSAERWRAYHLLEKTFKEQGPGYLLSDFDPYPFDRSLVIASNPFNLENQTDGSMEKAKWS